MSIEHVLYTYSHFQFERAVKHKKNMRRKNRLQFNKFQQYLCEINLNVIFGLTQKASFENIRQQSSGSECVPLLYRFRLSSCVAGIVEI